MGGEEGKETKPTLRSMIYFKKDERFYHVYLQSNFFGGITVICSWGVFDGNRGGYKYIFCDDKEQIADELQKITKLRMSRGYAPY